MGNSINSGCIDFQPKTIDKWSKPCNEFINDYINVYAKATGYNIDYVWNTTYKADLENNQALIDLSKYDDEIQNLIISLAYKGPTFNKGHLQTRQMDCLDMIQFFHNINFFSTIDDILKGKHPNISPNISGPIDINSVSIYIRKVNFEGKLSNEIDVKLKIKDQDIWVNFCLKL